jgi:hypothetical protein
MKANSPQTLTKASFIKAKKFEPAKKIAEVSSFKKKSSQMSALRSKMDMTGIGANGQPKAKRGKIISSLD